MRRQTPKARESGCVVVKWGEIHSRVATLNEKTS